MKQTKITTEWWSPVPVVISTKHSHMQASGNIVEEGWKDCKSQRTSKSAERLCLQLFVSKYHPALKGRQLFLGEMADSRTSQRKYNVSLEQEICLLR